MGNIIVGRYQQPDQVGYAGWIEPDDKSWIAFVDLHGQAQFFLSRDADGAVL